MKATLYTNLKPKLKIKNRSEVPKKTDTSRVTNIQSYPMKKPQKDKNTLKTVTQIIKKKNKNSISQIKIRSLNVNGLGQQGKREKTLKKLGLKNDDFIILVDTRLKGENLKKD